MSLDTAAPVATFTAGRLAVPALIALGAAVVVAALLYGFGHGPDWTLFARQPTVIHVHVAAAVTALVVGTVQLIGVKGTTTHRIIGWTWVAAILTVAISSLFIRQINSGAFSWIHLFSGWTLIAVPVALHAIRRGDVRRHGRTMIWMFIGGLLIAGAFTFVPGRLMWAVFLGQGATGLRPA